MNNKDDQLSFCTKNFKTISVPLLIIVIVYIVFIGIYTSSYSEKLGIMGDFIGGMLNPLLAFASFMGLLYTIKLQSDTINLQRQELELTRQEPKGSREAQQHSADTLSQQRFEMTFFSLLNTVNADIEAFKKSEGRIFSFDKIAILIYQLLKLIDNYNKNNKDKILDERVYSNILRACLDQGILWNLAGNCINQEIPSMDKHVKLIIKYRIFEHAIINLSSSNFIKFIVLYGDEAFGDNLSVQNEQIKGLVKYIKSNDS